MCTLGVPGKLKYILIEENSACGQLGLASMKDLPTDVEGYPY